MRVHPEVMPPTQRHVLEQLGAALTTQGFYLGGGADLQNLWVPIESGMTRC